MPKKTAKPAVMSWEVVVDGQKMTVIDPKHSTLEEIKADMEDRFGAGRVESVKRKK